MSSFDEVRFPDPDGLSPGVQWGVSYSTVVITTGAGFEQRNQQWSRGRRTGRIRFIPQTLAQAQALVDFFEARAGRARGFRFKDPRDYTATEEPLDPDGSPTVQLIKTYSSGGVDRVRNIYKPVSATVTLERNGSSYTSFVLDYNSGTVYLTALTTANITAITKAATAQITTSAAHGLTVGQTVWIDGAVGMTEINDQTATILTTPTSTTLTVDINSTDYTTYVSGGVVQTYVQPSDTLEWTGEFDVPVRFDTDVQELVQQAPDWHDWDNIPIVELREAPTAVLPVILDSFNRADSGSLGNTDTGQAWSVTTGSAFGIASNRAVVTSTGTNPTAHLEGSVTGRRVAAKLYSGGGPSSPGVCIRVVDHLNFIVLTRESSNFKILSCDAGVFGLVADGGAIALPEGDTYELVDDGGTIKGYRNGTLLASGTSGLHSSSTRYGFQCGAVINSVEDFEVE